MQCIAFVIIAFSWEPLLLYAELAPQAKMHIMRNNITIENVVWFLGRGITQWDASIITWVSQGAMVIILHLLRG